MRRCDCVRNLDTRLVCARKHRQMTMRCPYSSAEPQYSLPRAHGLALHKGFTWTSRGQVVVKQVDVERESNWWGCCSTVILSIFQFIINLQNNNTGRAETLSTGGNYYNSSSQREGSECNVNLPLPLGQQSRNSKNYVTLCMSEVLQVGISWEYDHHLLLSSSKEIAKILPCGEFFL